MPTPLPWPDCRNARDLGGIPTSDGGQIRDNALLRADSLHRLTAKGIAMCKAAGVSRILDLRNVDEAEAQPHPFGELSDVYRLVPMIDPAREKDRNRSAERSLADIYKSSLERNTRSIVESVATIADAPDGPVLVHCFAGKDRTGMVVALSLSVAGVSDEVIAEDYALSEINLREEIDVWLSTVEDEERRRRAERLTSRPETMLSMLEHLHAKWGDARGYLLQNGLTEDQVGRLRDRLRA